MAPRTRVKRASAVDLYRTCKQAGTCPPDVIPKIEGTTIADKILQYGSLGVFFGGLGIGTGRGLIPGVNIPKLVSRGSGYLPLDTTGSTLSLSSTGAVRGVAARLGNIRPVSGAAEIIPLETFSTTGDAPISEVVPEASSVLTPETVLDNAQLGEADIVTDAEVPQITLYSPSGPEDVAVIEVRPTEHDGFAHTLSSTVHQNPTFVSPDVAVFGETSNSENIFLGGGNVGDNTSEAIELSVFEPRSSTPEGEYRPPAKRGRWNWFSRRYYTQVPVQDPDFNYSFENPLYEYRDKAYIPPDVSEVTQSRLVLGPSGRVGVSRLAKLTTIGTRSGVKIGDTLHLRQSLSTIESPEIELLPVTSVQEDTPVTTEINVYEPGFEDIDLDNSESEPLLSTHTLRSGSRRKIITPVQNTSSNRPWSAVVITDNDTVTAKDIINMGADEAGSGSHADTTPTVVIDGQVIEWYFTAYLHPSLYRKKRKRTHSFL
ncbi:L2 protein [Okapia johnstoni papillomavirus 1]|uniref:Minor capsid protein L2 n=1 Tax=Okapia johnstoni papillomavirus 1 TaxID=2304449 RepID=A0A346LUY8_9PAPI|nr:L2 protein [Okapia johnstoni papillomavirus 1]